MTIRDCLWSPPSSCSALSVPRRALIAISQPSRERVSRSGSVLRGKVRKVKFCSTFTKSPLTFSSNTTTNASDPFFLHAHEIIGINSACDLSYEIFQREDTRMLAFEARQLISQRGLSRFSGDGREQKGTRVEVGLFLAA